LLAKLRRLQLIVCPYSESHEKESLIFEFGDALKKMYEDLGGRNSFKGFDSIKSQQICELAHAWSEESEPEHVLCRIAIGSRANWKSRRSQMRMSKGIPTSGHVSICVLMYYF
jgi:hypothetical protein